MICNNCIHKDVCKHKTESVYACENYKEGIITCKNCKYRETLYPAKEIGKEAICGYKCQIIGTYISLNHYCSYAEKKSEVTE